LPQCSHCFLDLDRYPALEGGLCPNCGRSQQSGEQLASAAVVQVGPGAPYALFERFWKTSRDVIFRPAQFFSDQAPAIVGPGGLSTALAFAVIVQWLASFCNFIWRSTAGVVLTNRMNDLFRIAGEIMDTKPEMSESLDHVRSRAIEFLFGAGAIVLTPFTTLLKLAIVALFVHAAVRFFMKEELGRPHSYSATLKILALASAPWLFCVIPGVGILLAWVLTFSAAVIGLREVYRTTTFRAALAVTFPELLFAAFLFGIVVFFLFIAFNVMRLVF
jgi:hypothetical protein